MSLISLLVVVIVICVLFWAVKAILAATNVGEPVSTIVIVAFVLIVLMWFLNSFGVGGFKVLHL